MEQSVPVRRIMTVADMSRWSKSAAYVDYYNFVKQLNEYAKAVHDGLYDLDTIVHPVLRGVRDVIGRLSVAMDNIKPIDNDKNQRFGNKAYRVWFDYMKSELCSFFKDNYSPERGTELRAYLEESFGNQQRIDYGTGHEMNFVIFLMGVTKLELCDVPKDQLKSIYHQMLTIFAASYLPLCRKVQLTYTLEPAGSHGVFSLDDFQFLPFLFGSAQLVHHPTIEPSNFPEVEIAEAYADKFMFHGAVSYIHSVKNGPFAEHSNQLWNISGVEEWSKVNKGLLRMYNDEVLSKFPIVQHLLFGTHVMKWT